MLRRKPLKMILLTTRKARCFATSSAASASSSSPPPPSTVSTRDPSSFHLFDDDSDDAEVEKNFRIDAHTDEWFEINREELRSSIFVHKNFRALWKPLKAEDISIDSLVYAKLLEETPDVFLFGTGKTLKQVPEESLKWARKMGMAVEVMDTANCVATFNVLVEEGRNVACGILLSGGTSEGGGNE